MAVSVRTALVAAAAVAVSLLVVVVLVETTGTTAPLVALAAVTVSAWFAGLPGGLVATALALVLMPLVLPPGLTYILTPGDAIRLALLGILGVGTSVAMSRYGLVNQTLKTTMTSIADGVLVTDGHGHVVEMNEAACALTGWSPADAIGSRIETVFKVVDEQTRQPLPGAVDRALREKRTVAVPHDAVLVARDGRERLVQGTGSPLRDRSGAIAGSVLIFRDDTERRQASQQMRDSEARFRTLADGAPVLIWTNDRDGCEFVNREYLRFTGLSLEQAMGMAWVSSVHPDDVEAYLGAYRRAFEARDRFEGQFRFRRYDGEYRWMKSVGLPRFTARGELMGYVGSSTDVTDMKRAEELLQEQVQLKNEFLATLSHELRTPLNAVLGWARLLAAGDLEPERVPHALQAIERNAWAQRQLIDDLLDLSRIVTGSMRLELEPVDIETIVLEGMEPVRLALEAKELTFTFDSPDEPLAVVGDPARLRQVMWNVLNNAVKFTPRGGRIAVRAARQGSNVEVQVTDTGQGIAPAFLPHIFDRFRQEDSSTTRSAGGLGLGLAIVRHIIEAHGGIVTAHSEGPGTGTTVILQLPLQARVPVFSGGGDDAGAGAKDVLQRLDGISVLVVDDVPDARELLRASLEVRGARVAEAGSVAAARSVISRSRPDVILTDIGMPGESGHALLAWVRAHDSPVIARTPVLAVTAYSLTGEGEAADSGYTRYIVKPIAPHALAAAIAEAAAGR